MSKITISELTKVYAGNVTALHGVDLTVKDGELLVLVGPSGCGKSTLLPMIAGLESITTGTIAIDDEVVNEVESAQRDISMVFQNYVLYPHMTVRGNLEYGLKNRKVPAEDGNRMVDDAARILEIEPYLDRKPSFLSGGQHQRGAMGRALVRQPRAFLFDEPLSNLDAQLRGHMRLEIRNLQRRLKTASVFVTHDQLEAMTLADTLVVMKAGRIEQMGTPFEVYSNPATTFVAKFIGSPGMNIVPRAEIGTEAGDLTTLPSEHGFLGFRPEPIKFGWTDIDGLKLNAEIEGVEVLGSELLVHLNLAGVKDTIVAKVDTNPSFPITGPIEFEVTLSDLHSFDG
jgi:sn-glycerol 3-phosphate transport system ATP-binding protein